MADGHRNENTGSAQVVAQVGTLTGDMHLHMPWRQAELRNQVPNPTSHYTNNERQLSEISAALLRSPDEGQVPAIAVIVGPPGSGKSATGYRWVFAHSNAFPDGVFYAPLGSGLDGAGASGAESEALRQFLIRVGFESHEIPDSLASRAAWFREWSIGKRVAVVIDDAVRASQVRHLLPGVGRSAVLVTSVGDLSGLRATEQVTFVEITPLEPESARELLRRIAGAPLVDAEPAAVEELIGLCQGSALALSVAAVLLLGRGERPVAPLVARLSREGRLVRGLSRDPELSVDVVFDAAADRLTSAEHGCYLAFGQHQGDGDISLEALVAGLDAELEDVEAHLDRLVAAKLVTPTGKERYWANRLVREHARRRAELGEGRSAEARQIRDRLASYYRIAAVRCGHAMNPKRGWLERFWPGLTSGGAHVEKAQAQQWLEAERRTLRAVIDDDHREGRVETCVLAIALWPLYEHSKDFADLEETSHYAERLAEHWELPLVRTLALVQRGFAPLGRQEYAAAAELFAQARKLCTDHGDLELTATAIESQALAARGLGQIAQARELFEENLELARRSGNPQRVGVARMHLGSVAPVSEAVLHLEEAVAWFEKSDAVNTAKTRMWLGMRLGELGVAEAAGAALHQALDTMLELRRHTDVAQIRLGLADLALADGDREEARAQQREAQALYRAQGWSLQAEQVEARLAELEA
ncbi:hypothetical protein ABZ805_12215 [Saccharopolyspora sp. NPDC047091]|uniref:hypothetical protein n=1 Tax=Saccharopolyspora sp. NPDC047091 TaxID=3155924 RepID=UPI00340329D9